MSTKVNKKKQQKQTRRRKQLDKQRNQKRNKANYQYQLEVFFDDNWQGVKQYRTKAEVQAHLDETEAIRKQGDVPIVEGRIMSIRTGSELVHIPPFEPVSGPSMVEAARTPHGALVGVNVDISSEKPSGLPGNE